MKKLISGDRQEGCACARSNKSTILTLNPLQYKFDFWMYIRGISHGFNGTHAKLVMARNLTDIL